LINLDEVSTLFREPKLPPSGALCKILLKVRPNSIPRHPLLLGHSVDLRVASVTPLAFKWLSTTEHDQRQFRSPFQPLTRFDIKPKARGHVVQARPLGIEFMEPQCLFLMRRVHEYQPGRFARISCDEAPGIEPRDRMTHQDERPLLARRCQPPMQIVYDFINRLQFDRSFVALAKIGVIVTAYSRESRCGRLDRCPILGCSPARRNQYHCWRTRSRTVAIDGQATISHADHPLFAECRS